MDDEQPDLLEDDIRWHFEPLIPLRTDMMREVVFTKKWQKLVGGATIQADRYFIDNERYRYPYLQIHQEYLFDVPGIRDSRLATSVINWLGTNLGQRFLDDAEALKPKFEKYSSDRGRQDYSDSYTAAWALLNRHNGQPMEITPRLTLSEPLARVFGKAAGIRDFIVMESIIDWLGKPDGQSFLKKCETNINLKLSRIREQRHQQITQARARLE